MKKENVILSSPVKYSREGVSAEIKQMLINFYQSEEVSQMRPGKKDCYNARWNKGESSKKKLAK